MRRLKIGWVIGLVVASSAACARLGSSESELGRSQDTPLAESWSSDQRELYTFDDVALMVAASDIVILGEVVKSGQGRSVPDNGDSGGLDFTNVTIDTTRTLFGDPVGSITLEVDDVFLPRREPWAVPGNEVLLFLHRKLDQPAFFRPTSTQSVFVIDGELVVPGITKDKFTLSLAGAGRDEVLQRVELAAADVERGAVSAPPTR